MESKVNIGVVLFLGDSSQVKCLVHSAQVQRYFSSQDYTPTTFQICRSIGSH